LFDQARCWPKIFMEHKPGLLKFLIFRMHRFQGI